MRTDLNALYAEWSAASTETKDTAQNQLGEALYRYITLVVRKQFPEWSRYLLVENDALGEAAHKIFTGLDTFNPLKGTFAQWTYGVTCNACIDLLRQRKQRSEVQYFEIDNPVVSEGHTAKLFLDKLRYQLTEDENELIALKLDGNSNEQIAEALSTTKGYVEVKWDRLVRKLRTLGGGENNGTEV